jgi:hypothetical protein
MTEFRKLNIQERIRLEALNQANSVSAFDKTPIDEILQRAKAFEAYIKTGATEKAKQ